MRPEWVERYVRRLDDHRLPKSKEARQAESEKIGADGQEELLDAIYSEDAPSWLRELPAVETLRKVWMQNSLPRARREREVAHLGDRHTALDQVVRRLPF